MFEQLLIKKETMALNTKELQYIVNGYLNGSINDLEMTKFLKLVCERGMTFKETSDLTDIMLSSGDCLDLSDIKGLKVDKHSTGGIGDKTTLVVCPLVASLGVPVAKMSGRGLGYTGGTIDKLEAIPSFRTSLSLKQFKQEVKTIGIAIASQTGNLVPADKKIYALRDVTNTVSSIPLIASSIMSKKLASGADKIVIDVKVGRGSLLATKEEAHKLATYMINIGKRHNREVVCVLTNMNEPLGYAVGNELEVVEAINTLQNKGPKDFTKLVIKLATVMVSLGLKISEAKALTLVKTNLQNGQAYQKFLELVAAQGGHLNLINDAKQVVVKSLKDGYITQIDALKIGELSRELGAGRLTKNDIIDYQVGVELKRKVGAKVKVGDPLLTIYYRTDAKINDFRSCFIINSNPVKKQPLIYEVIK